MTNTTTSDTARNRSWFALRYTTDALPGLPPIIEADQVMRYSDHTGAWLVALWVNTAGADGSAASILRVPAAHVELVTRHPDMGQAATAAGLSPSPI